MTLILEIAAGVVLGGIVLLPLPRVLYALGYAFGFLRFIKFLADGEGVKPPKEPFFDWKRDRKGLIPLLFILLVVSMVAVATCISHQ